MKLAGSYTFNAPQDLVWSTLMDIDVLQTIIPGCQKLEQIGENEYESAMKIKVGTIQGKFKGKVALTDINAPDNYRMQVKGKGAPGHMAGEGYVRLEANNGTTILHYDGEAKIGGKIASLGQRLMTTTAKSLIQHGLKQLDKQIQANLKPPKPEPSSTSSSAPSPTPTSAPRPTVPPPSETVPPPPSQTEFAVGVAKNMLDDVVPPENRPILMATIGGGIGALLLAWWLAKRTDTDALSHQLTDIRENQIRPVVADLSHQLAELEAHQVRPFIEQLGEQLAELDQNQLQPFINELSSQLTDLSENKIQPLVNELSEQLTNLSQNPQTSNLTTLKAGLTVGTAMAAILSFFWWFINRQTST